MRRISGLRAWIGYSVFQHRHEFYLTRFNDDQRQIARIVWEDVDEAVQGDPTFMVSEQDETESATLQALANQLCDLGFKPRGEVRGETAALRDHLADMKDILHKLLPSAVRK